AYREIFFAINPTVEGEATIMYISDLLKGGGARLTRIAYGLPTGANIDYADELTIARAYAGRVEI
ncbi:recombination protein RecR, partial [Candidatus Termititenax persephonae]